VEKTITSGGNSCATTISVSACCKIAVSISMGAQYLVRHTAEPEMSFFIYLHDCEL